MKNLVVAICLVFGFSGCVTVKTLQPTGGSKSDGVVYLSYEYGGFEQPKVQWEEGLTTARQRCIA